VNIEKRFAESDVLDFEEHRPALTGHCYRMLGSVCDAEDSTQEAMIRAWRGLDSFDGRASVRTWLYRIATNVCLDELNARSRRRRPIESGIACCGSPPAEGLVQKPREYWIEPIADARALPRDADPSERAALKQSLRLAFVAAVQKLPPKQRAVLLLMEVLGFSASEAAEMLETSIASVNSALQRARATLENSAAREPADLTETQIKTVNAYMAAFERYDLDALVALLTQDATLSMPPYELWLRGPDDIRTWMLGPGCGCRGSRLIPAAACGSPAFGQHRVDPEGGYKAWALIVLEFAGDHIIGVNSFLDTETLFPRFELPIVLPA
jgi:RNA polymerase sigma-70 factor (ECF subfamily)